MSGVNELVGTSGATGIYAANMTASFESRP
jgi:hypothetical protein